jgi:hypothetical protein
MSRSRILVLVDRSESAESLSDGLQLRGFAAQAISDVVDLGLSIVDGWKVDAQAEEADRLERPCVVAADGERVRRMRPVAPNGLLSALRNLT